MRGKRKYTGKEKHTHLVQYPIFIWYEVLYNDWMMSLMFTYNSFVYPTRLLKFSVFYLVHFFLSYYMIYALYILLTPTNTTHIMKLEYVHILPIYLHSPLYYNYLNKYIRIIQHATVMYLHKSSHLIKRVNRTLIYFVHYPYLMLLWNMEKF